MNVEELRGYCLTLPAVEENQPWTEPQYEMLVTYRVGGKWFLLANPNEKFIDVKCDPERIVELQSRYQGAFPAWHMNKEHWLGIRLDSDVPDTIIKQVIKDGYNLILRKLPQKIRKNLAL